MDKGNVYGSRFGAADKDIRFHLCTIPSTGKWKTAPIRARVLGE